LGSFRRSAKRSAGHLKGRQRRPVPRPAYAHRQSPQKRERVPQDMFDPVLQRFVIWPSVRVSVL
jgi:hypothetical protein